MARIIGVEVPPNKRIDIALRYIYGIGPTNAVEILAKAKIDPSIRAKDLSEYFFQAERENGHALDSAFDDSASAQLDALGIMQS